MPEEKANLASMPGGPHQSGLGSRGPRHSTSLWPRRMMAQARVEMSAAKRPWARVAGPAAAMFMSATRLMYCTSTAMSETDIDTATAALYDSLEELRPYVENEWPDLLND